MKNPRITAAIATLCEAFNRQPTPATFAAYELGLRGLSVEEIESATAQALQKCKFMPVPAELRELVGSGGESYQSMAERAFLELDRAVSRHGSDRSVNFDDGAIHATVRRLGGWGRCCEQPRARFEEWYRKDFVKTYVEVCKHGASEEERSYLVGNNERLNAAWVGRTLPGGGTYKLGMFGSGINDINVGYAPALPAPEPRQALAAPTADVGLQLKRIGSSVA